MKKVLLLLMLSLLASACTETGHEAWRLHGAWTLSHVEHPIGTEYDFSLEDEPTFCIVYDGDSLLYTCQMAKTPSGLVVVPVDKSSVTLIDKGGGELLYLEGGDPHPLTVGPDSVITIQRRGVQYTWVRADDIFNEWGPELRRLISDDLQYRSDAPNRYVLSARERRQERTIQGFTFLIGFIVLLALFAVYVALTNRRARERLQLQLQQIQEVQENRQPTVWQAVATVENSYFASDDYAALQRRMAGGQRLKADDWSEVERQLRAVYPGFTSQLRSLRPLSELEYEVCLLIKLRIAPKDIAQVLARDVSTISTVRSRLYAKVFGTKGGAKDWDDFILSLGT